MDSCPRVWNLLHDGSIVRVSGNRPGTLIAEIDIQYLRERFNDPGDKILLTLFGCSRLTYKPWLSTNEEITDLQQIAERELEVLSADLQSGCCVIHCSEGFGAGGTLEVISEGVSLALDSGRDITLDELEEVSAAYWSEWQAEGSAN